MVGLQTLNLPILVRAQASEPHKKIVQHGFFYMARQIFFKTKTYRKLP